MTSRNMRISLVTAAVIAALAATSCGSNGLNEGLNEDIDLVSSSPAPEAGLEEVKSLMDMELDVDFEIDDRMQDLTEGQHSYAANTYRVKENAELHEEEVGLGFDGENFQPIYEYSLQLFSDSDVLSSAMWGFTGASEDLGIQAVRLKGKLEMDPDNGYYLAVSNYSTGRYELIGPFQSTSSWIDIRGLAVPSPDGELHIAVIIHNGAFINLESFEIRTEEPLQQAF